MTWLYSWGGAIRASKVMINVSTIVGAINAIVAAYLMISCDSMAKVAVTLGDWKNIYVRPMNVNAVIYRMVPGQRCRTVVLTWGPGPITINARAIRGLRRLLMGVVGLLCRLTLGLLCRSARCRSI